MEQEFRDGAYTVSTARARLDVDQVCAFLGRSYWAGTRPRDVVEKSLDRSLCYGIYEGRTQVGFARVVTDYCTFAYLCDVFIDEGHRGKGLGKWLMDCILRHPELQSLRRFVLATRDAHELYRGFGFGPVDAARFMERRGEA